MRPKQGIKEKWHVTRGNMQDAGVKRSKARGKREEAKGKTQKARGIQKDSRGIEKVKNRRKDWRE
jgi:uncharacterized protein YjbJ (UPF0337 family)